MISLADTNFRKSSLALSVLVIANELKPISGLKMYIQNLNIFFILVQISHFQVFSALPGFLP